MEKEFNLTRKELEMNAEDWKQKYIESEKQIKIIKEKVELLYKLSIKNNGKRI